MTVVVTGASGFIGSALVRHLRGEGRPVIAVSRRALAEELLPVGRRVGSYDELQGGEQLVHLAETAHIATSEAEGEAGVEERVRTFEQLAARFDHVLYVSSAAVYGDEVPRPRTPDEVLVPRGAYTGGKLRCEAIATVRGGTVARLGNVYGPGMASGTIVSDVLVAARAHGPLRVRQPAPVRDFVHVQDCVKALGFLCARRSAGVFNVATGVGTAVGALAMLVLSLRGEPHRKVVATEPTGRPSTLILDITSTTAACGYVPLIALRQGLEPLIRTLESP